MPGTSTVLITGESGTGKELVATAIWKTSDRRDATLRAINCGAIPEPLLESDFSAISKGRLPGGDQEWQDGVNLNWLTKGLSFWMR